MTVDEAEDWLRRNVVAELGEVRAAELAPAIRTTAEAMARVMSAAIGVDEEDPDFARPLG